MELHELGRKPTFTVSTWTWAQSLKITDNHYKTHTLSLSHTLTLSLSLSHTHTHTHTLSLSHTHTLTLTHTASERLLPPSFQMNVKSEFGLALLSSRVNSIPSQASETEKCWNHFHRSRAMLNTCGLRSDRSTICPSEYNQQTNEEFICKKTENALFYKKKKIMFLYFIMFFLFFC